MDRLAIVVPCYNEEEVFPETARQLTAVVEDLIGIDLPNDMIEKVVEGVKAKISLDKVGDALGALGSLFGKK